MLGLPSLGGGGGGSASSTSPPWEGLGEVIGGVGGGSAFLYAFSCIFLFFFLPLSRCYIGL